MSVFLLCRINHTHTGQLTCPSDNAKDEASVDAFQDSQQSYEPYITRMQMYNGRSAIENSIPQLLEELDEMLSFVSVTI